MKKKLIYLHPKVTTGGHFVQSTIYNNNNEIFAFSGTSQISHQLNVNSLLPRTQFFLTYEGSLTEPPCTETVIWIILNRPIYVSEKNLFSLRNSIVIDGYGDNFRLVMIFTRFEFIMKI